MKGRYRTTLEKTHTHKESIYKKIKVIFLPIISKLKIENIKGWFKI